MFQPAKTAPLVDIRCMVIYGGEQCHLTIDLTRAANRLGNSEHLVDKWEGAIAQFLATHPTDHQVDLRQHRHTNAAGGEQRYIACIGLTPQLATELGQKLDELYAQTIQVGTTRFAEQITQQLAREKPSNIAFSAASETALGSVERIIEKVTKVRKDAGVAFKTTDNTSLGNVARDQGQFALSKLAI